MLKMEYVFNIENTKTGKYGIQFSNNQNESVSFTFDVEKNIYAFDRTKSGDVSFNNNFATSIQVARRISDSALLSGTIILDVASIEIFADDGLNVFTATYFPTELFENIHLTSINTDANSATVQSISVSSLNSIWSN